MTDDKKPEENIEEKKEQDNTDDHDNQDVEEVEKTKNVEPTEEAPEEQEDTNEVDAKSTDESPEDKEDQGPLNDMDVDENAGMVVINKGDSDQAKWYVVHTYSGHENKVASQLKERVEAVGHTDKFFKILIPQQQKIIVSEGKKRTVDERLFPGYIIVQMIMNDDTWYLVRSTRGVTGFVGTGSNPTPLPEKEVHSLVNLMKTEEPKFEAKFSVGDSVKITDGPFSEFLGKVDEVNEEQGKLKVLVSVFGRETPVELDFIQVKSL